MGEPNQIQRPKIARVVVLVLLLVVVQYYTLSLLSFYHHYYPLYHSRLQPETEILDTPAVPEWACTGLCYPTRFNESQFHCEGCFQPSLVPTQERKKQVAAWEVRCNTINDYYERSTFTMRAHDCEHSLVSLLLGAILDQPTKVIHPVQVACWLVTICTFVIQMFSVSYGVWRWIEWKDKVKKQKEEEEKQAIKDRARQEIEGPSASLMQQSNGDADGLRRRVAIQMSQDLQSFHGPAFASSM